MKKSAVTLTGPLVLTEHAKLAIDLVAASFRRIPDYTLAGKLYDEGVRKWIAKGERSA